MRPWPSQTWDFSTRLGAKVGRVETNCSMSFGFGSFTSAFVLFIAKSADERGP